MQKVYLSGRTKNSSVLESWQDIAIRSLDSIECFDPRKPHKVEGKRFIEIEPNNLLRPAETDLEAVRLTLQAVKSCEVVLACLEPDNPDGTGLSLEAGYATAYNIPIVFVCADKDKRGKMLKRLAAKTVNNLQDGIKAVKDILIAKGAIHEVQ